MNNALFEQLLYEEESNTLDFKEKQYRFARATNEEKSEILKDILGFANAWRRSDAYIIVGVKEIRGGRSVVVGISANEHLDEHSLQQFVNHLTNQPIHFSYEAFGFEGKQVGIIKIGAQNRPVYLRRDYGRLKKEKVFIRRGSSTDPTSPASIDEIAMMRSRLENLPAELRIEFAHVNREEALGTKIDLETEFCEMPEKNSIPDLSDQQNQNPFEIGIPRLSDFMININKDYFRELADYKSNQCWFKPVRLVITNVGHLAAKKILVEVTVPIESGVILLDQDDMPAPPKCIMIFLTLPLSKVMCSPIAVQVTLLSSTMKSSIKLKLTVAIFNPDAEFFQILYILGR